jgi:hypothetical protein
MDLSTALFVTMFATVVAIVIVLFGTMLIREEPLRRGMLKSFAISVVGGYVLLRGQLFGGANTGFPVVAATTLLICCGLGTVIGGTASTLLMKGWKAWLKKALPKP